MLFRLKHWRKHFLFYIAFQPYWNKKKKVTVGNFLLVVPPGIVI
ncbi:hypothetical protein HMPREF9441_00760 [Paraprevotella clara YIT 11840]|uniref:Uncharacterized protein n=1 Tax=Paraprevotella clara YIT 11840 TaxID=762968 RepID=G5SN32_9BACT|nr:hypothetical protein HMPREF9441_00760 [Paraprevotella clara YIT 11840]